MTINDLHMTEEQIVNEIQFMRVWDKYLQKMLGKEKHSELSLGFARMLTSAELKSFGASDEEIEKACNFADMMAIADEHKADTPQTESLEYHTDTTHFGKAKGKSVTTDTADTPQTDLVKESDDVVKDLVEEETEAERLDRIDNEIEDVWARIRELTPQTESTGSPIGDYRDGVGAWQTDRMTEEEFDTMIAKGLLGQTDCNDRYAVRTDSGEVVAYACPLGCEQTDCPWK